MPLSSAQLVTLKADILANSAEFGSIPNTPDGNHAIAAAYSLLVTPNYFVWREVLTEDEVTMTTSNDGAVSREFSWAGSGGFIARSVGEQNAWARLFREGFVAPSRVNTRQAFADIFSGGTAGATNNRAHMLALAIRPAKRIEKLFAVPATGPGNDGIALNRGLRSNPDAMTYLGDLSPSDVEAARNLP